MSASGRASRSWRGRRSCAQQPQRRGERRGSASATSCESSWRTSRATRWPPSCVHASRARKRRGSARRAGSKACSSAEQRKRACVCGYRPRSPMRTDEDGQISSPRLSRHIARRRAGPSTRHRRLPPQPAQRPRAQPTAWRVTEEREALAGAACCATANSRGSAGRATSKPSERCGSRC